MVRWLLGLLTNRLHKVTTICDAQKAIVLVTNRCCYRVSRHFFPTIVSTLRHSICYRCNAYQKNVVESTHRCIVWRDPTWYSVYTHMQSEKPRAPIGLKRRRVLCYSRFSTCALRPLLRRVRKVKYVHPNRVAKRALTFGRTWLEMQCAFRLYWANLRCRGISAELFTTRLPRARIHVHAVNTSTLKCTLKRVIFIHRYPTLKAFQHVTLSVFIWTT